MKRIFVLLVAIFFLAGCASAKAKSDLRSEVRSKLLGVDKSDRISKDEAVILAQDFMIQNDADEYWQLKNPQVVNSGDFWSVIFAPRNRFSSHRYRCQPLELMVLKSDGTIPNQETLKIQ